mmetsp:Transcript_60566/g.69108  ORF Transcript_60566/g.69108 Transcript_60566/m.69108 type:complete len:94 (-) Transcript_60566:3926-4207(-)
MMANQNDNLQQGISKAYETLEIAHGIESELDSQSKRIRSSTDKTRRMMHDLGKSNRVVDRMQRTALENKAILCCVLTGIFLAIVLMVYFNFFA